MGVFAYVDDLLAALESLKKGGLDFTVFTPTPLHQIKEAAGFKWSPVGYFTLFGAIFGILCGLSLAVFTVLQWKFIVSGKPIVPWIPFVIIAFEFIILFGVIFTLTGLLITARLPGRRLPSYYNPRFSNDRFGILVRFPDAGKENIAKLLKESGAEEVYEVEG